MNLDEIDKKMRQKAEKDLQVTEHIIQLKKELLKIQYDSSLDLTLKLNELNLKVEKYIFYSDDLPNEDFSLIINVIEQAMQMFDDIINQNK